MTSFEKPLPSDDALKSAAREAGWALSTLVDEIRFEKRQQVVNIINRLSAALYALCAAPSPVDSRDALIERLVKALDPFARLGDDGWGSALPSERVLAVWWADDDKDPSKTKRPHITQGDIRNARRVLLAAKEQQP